MKFKGTTDHVIDVDDEDDTVEALPAKVAGMAIVPARVVASLALDVQEQCENNPEQGPWMLLLSSQGKGKRLALHEFKQQGRGGSGRRGIGLQEGDHLAAFCLTGVHPNTDNEEAPQEATEVEHVIIGTQEGVMNRLDVDSIRVQKGRSTIGVGVMKINQGDAIRDITVLPAEDVSLVG